MAFKMDSGITFAQFFNMTNDEKETYLKQNPFTYKNIDEYKKDICKWLTLSDWHYSKENAEEIVESRLDWIEECYMNNAPIDIAGAEAGYCCG